MFFLPIYPSRTSRAFSKEFTVLLPGGFLCFVYFFSRVLLLRSGVKATTVKGRTNKSFFFKLEKFAFISIIRRINLKWALSQRRTFFLHQNNELALLMTASFPLCIGEDFRRYHRRLPPFLCLNVNLIMQDWNITSTGYMEGRTLFERLQG